MPGKVLIINSIESYLNKENIHFSLRVFAIEIALIITVTFLFAGSLLNANQNALQQTGEHNEGSTLAILADTAINKYGEIPKWNPYIMTGFPHSGDPLTQFFNPISTLSYALFGPLRGLRVSVFIAFALAGVGQLFLGYVLGIKPISRIWGSILFLISGGLVMLWRAGTYGFIIGAAWFPFSLAFAIWALRSKRKLPIALAALSNAMLFLSGLIYWALYFFGSMIVILIFFITVSVVRNKNIVEAQSLIKKLSVITIFTVGLVAIYLIPMLDARTLVIPEAATDIYQFGSQPMPLAMINYIINDFEYFSSSILGKAASGSWFYIGVLPLLLLVFVPLTFSKSKERDNILLMVTLFIFLLAWHANRFTPIEKIYDFFPILYSFRHPHFLLIVAATPLIALASFGLDYLIDQVKSLNYALGLLPSAESENKIRLPRVLLKDIFQILIVIFLFFTIRDVYEINKNFGFSEGIVDTNAQEALEWLKEYDSSTYYINLGNGPIIWSWTPAAYLNEQKVINFKYGRVLSSWAHQNDSETALRASPKYIFAFPENPPEPPAELLETFEGISLYEIQDVLPYSFLIQENLLGNLDQNILGTIQEVESQFDGTNRIVLEARANNEGSVLIALESYYPGWTVYIDGEESKIKIIGDYIGVEAQVGLHNYVFSFEPAKFTMGWLISLVTIILLFYYLFSEKLMPVHFRKRTSPVKTAFNDGHFRDRRST